MNQRCCLLLLCAILFGLSPILEPVRAEAANSSSAAISTVFVQKFVSTHCSGCHGKDQPEADVSVARLIREGVSEESSELFGRVLEQLEFRSMPPAKETQPKQEDVNRVKRWIRQQLAEAGIQAEIDHKLKQPSSSYANLLPHEPLFDGSIKGPASSPPRILRFFREFFGYGDAEKVFKGDRGSRALHFSTLLQDADHLVLHFVKQDENVLAELLTTDRFFVVWRGREGYDRTIDYVIKRKKLREKPKDRNYRYFITRTEEKGLRAMPQANPEWRRVVRFYNFDEELWDYPLDQPFPMPKGQRVGILTHPAWLIAWSGNFDNDPIRRGKWIREHLLAGTIPDVPITVNAAVPEDPHKTLRQRLQVTREEYCWKCHQKMNPLGMPFEAYNDFGQFRDEEGLGHTKALQKPKKTAALVTTGEIINSGDPGIDGPVANVAELMEKLAGSDRVRQSFVRHTFRYWMGRNERLADSPTLMAADRAYKENGGSLKSLVISLLTSDSFLYRK